jgi:hypothetical protein
MFNKKHQSQQKKCPDMKKANFILLSALIFGISLLRCENEDLNISANVTNDPKCKSSKSAGITEDIPDTLSCIGYSYKALEKKLYLKHANAGFNCCPGKLSCFAEMKGDTIIIKESEESALCNCDCLYDLEIEITGLPAGQYVIKVIEPYSGAQQKIIFPVSFTEDTQSVFCVKRKLYPWGTGL